MYSIVTTPGFIIGSLPKGEASRLIRIFTRDLGLVMVSAEGIRLEKSKLRYYTQDFSLGTYSLVRGKEYWRLTSAIGASSGIRDRENPDDSILRAHLAVLLRRLLHGEEPHQDLFEIIKNCLEFSDNRPIHDLYDILESVTVYRIMRSLGYVGKDRAIGDRLCGAEVSNDLLKDAKEMRKIINSHINKALQESQL